MRMEVVDTDEPNHHEDAVLNVYGKMYNPFPSLPV